MKLRKTLLALLVLLVAAAIWSGVVWLRPVSPYATLKYLAPGQTNSAGEPFAAGTFYMTNLSNERIHMNASVIEVKNGDAWRIYTNVVVWDLRELGPFQSGYTAVLSPPARAPWRVHVWVSSEMHGLEALPGWLRLYTDRRTRQDMGRMFGWRLWKWPPFGRSVQVTVGGKGFELVSEEIVPNDKSANH